MTVKRPRDLALTVLNRLSRGPAFSQNILDGLFQGNPRLDARDRAFTSYLVQGVLRWRRRLDWTLAQASDFPIGKISPVNLNILRLALYQILFMDRVPDAAAVNEAVNQAKAKNPQHTVRFVNGVLRNICRGKDDLPLPKREEDLPHSLSVLHSYPLWMVKKWLDEWGVPFTEALLAAGNRLPVLSVRTNRLKIDRAGLIEHLALEGVHGSPASWGPEGIIIEGFRGRIDGLASFKSGLYQIQDQAAQITSHLLHPRPNENILDVCAGYGGKTTHLAELTGNRGRILALDISGMRLVKLVRNARRLGIDGILPLVADASKSLSSLLRRKFDRILIDAPCSGLGVISRHPDIKWNRHEKDIQQLPLLQKSILDRAVPLLGEDGQMLYVTCTISRQENEQVVEDCLRLHPDLSLKNLKDQVPPWGKDLIDQRGFFRTIPHVHYTDGFFAALFARK